MTGTVGEKVASVLIGLAAAVVVIAIAILPFLSPPWVSVEQGRAQSAEWTGYTPGELATATNAILHDLVIGPPAFDVQVNGQPVLEERERAHMRDVRGVFAGFYALAIAAAAVLVVLLVVAVRRGRSARAWRAVQIGMQCLAVAIVIAGVVATFFFDQAFAVFHELFFPSGSYTFDVATDKLVQLFPDAFWSETTIALGGFILLLAAAVWLVARRLARRAPATAPAGAPGPAPVPTEGPVA
ncbi:MAG TPA: TIGR01906 family membrane protein [Candidatus Limnocylindrales bacterium]